MRLLTPVVAFLLLAGTLYRLWPAAAGMPALANHFITEDGYLLATVARNLGIGNGMTVSNGSIATNGVQPLITFLFAVPYWATGGDKVASLVWVHVLHAAIALGGAFAIRAFAARLLQPRDPSPVWPWAVALLWFLGPVALRHSMNGLETGLYTTMIAATLAVLHRRIEAGTAAGWELDLGLGALCGLTILSRIDGGLFVVAVFALWAGTALFREGGIGRAFARLLAAGLVTTLIAGPWFARNLLVFGALMPISGDAQKLDAEFGGNLPLLASKLFELAFPMLPVPGRIEALSAVQALLMAVLAVVFTLALWRLARHTPRAAQIMAAAYLIHAIALATYYGVVFGAGHFLSRYLAPLSPLLITLSLVAALELGRRLRARPALLPGLYAGGGVALSLALLGLLLGPLRIPQGHEQTITWTETNVPEEVWVGAPQTGTLGYWHDRTINLDGKVNPEALTARRENRVLDYVVASDIDYVIDWAGVGDWMNFEAAQGPDGFAETFELVLQDNEHNLSVMRRKKPRFSH